ncbi:unnamed protein product [Adineta ricciae]|uniref:Uncharacterized protein n=2 Tax=Adineta ricciae TaxID=249248 RepID=A0A814UP17_ADIRI|nr:unnamed protein product [Adineta ricciae]
MNCSNVFHLNILSRSQFINQYDQLLLRFGYLGEEEHVYKLIVNAFDCNPVEKCREGRRLNNSMMIEIEILNSNEELDLIPLNFDLIIPLKSPLKQGDSLGQVKLKQKRENLLFEISNEIVRNDIKVNEQTGELILLNEKILSNRNSYSFAIRYFHLRKQKFLPKQTQISIYFRFMDQIQIISLSYFNQSSVILSQNENLFLIPDKFPLNSSEILFSLQILPFYYSSDEYFLYLNDHQSTFSLIHLQKNIYSLKRLQSSLFHQTPSHFLHFSLQHQLTKQFLSSEFLIELHSISNRTNLCQKHFPYEIFESSTKNHLGNLQVLHTSNEEISSFSSFQVSEDNPNEIFIDQCRMELLQLNSSFPLSQFQLCSSFLQSCFEVQSNVSSSTRMFSFEPTKIKLLFSLAPIELAMVSFAVVFILVMFTMIVIICRLKGVNLCLRIKNYLFYGKKYGLSHAQRLSNAKMTQRVHSIVIRESHSPSMESIKEKTKIDEFAREESNSQINVSNDSSRDSGSNRILEETNQLLDLLVSNRNLHSPRLASEV